MDPIRFFSENPAIVTMLTAGAVALSAANAFAMLKKLVVKRNAEEHLLKLLSGLLGRDRRWKVDIEHVRATEAALRTRHMLSGVDASLEHAERELTPSEYDVLLSYYRQYLESAIKEMPPRERREIEEALHQPSRAGQSRYLRRILAAKATIPTGELRRQEVAP